MSLIGESADGEQEASPSPPPRGAASAYGGNGEEGPGMNGGDGTGGVGSGATPANGGAASPAGGHRAAAGGVVGGRRTSNAKGECKKGK